MRTNTRWVTCRFSSGHRGSGRVEKSRRRWAHRFSAPLRRTGRKRRVLKDMIGRRRLHLTERISSASGAHSSNVQG